MSFIMRPVRFAPTGHIIEGSGLFDSATGKLLRTGIGASSRTTWSVRVVTKMNKIPDGSTEPAWFTGYTGAGGNYVEALVIQPTGAIQFLFYNAGATGKLKTTQLFRDYSGYLDILAVCDTSNSTAGDRMRLYINGTRVTDFSATTNPSLNYNTFTGAASHNVSIGGGVAGYNGFIGDYLAHASFIDGQALDPTSFGEVTDDGFWQINDVSGLTFGTNGFLIEGGVNVSNGTDTQAGGTFAQQKTEFLTHFDGSDAATSSTDVSLAERTLTFNGNAQLDTAQKHFGTASLLLDGTGDSVSSADNPAYDIAALDFTMDAWIRLASDASGVIMSKWGASGQRGWLFSYDAGSSLLDWRTSTNGSNNANQVNETWNPSLNTWYHVAAERTGGKVNLYVDGTKLGSGDSNSDTVYANTAKFEVGSCENTGALTFNGHIDEPRFVLGVGLYGGSNFTPKTAAYTNPKTANPFTKTGTITATNDSPTNGDA